MMILSEECIFVHKNAGPSKLSRCRSICGSSPCCLWHLPDRCCSGCRKNAVCPGVLLHMFLLPDAFLPALTVLSGLYAACCRSFIAAETGPCIPSLRRTDELLIPGKPICCEQVPAPHGTGRHTVRQKRNRPRRRSVSCPFANKKSPGVWGAAGTFQRERINWLFSV